MQILNILIILGEREREGGGEGGGLLGEREGVVEIVYIE